MIPENIRTSDSLRLGPNVTDKVNLKTIDKLGLNVTDKVNLKTIDKFVISLNLSVYCAWRNIKVI